MRFRTAILFAAALAAPAVFSLLYGQDAPQAQTGSATVARPRPKPNAPPAADSTITPPPAASSNTSSAPNPDDNTPIPSKLSPKATKDKEPPTDVTFRADADVVTVDVAVVDSKGNPIPNLDKKYFRILEDNVPQNISQFSV